MLSILASMKVELEGYGGIDKGAEYWSECELNYTGIGQENVDQTMDNLELTSNLDGVVSVGFAGSIDPEIDQGDLCIIDRVSSEGGEAWFKTNPDLRKRAELALGQDLNSCKLLTLEEPVAEPEEKKELAGNDYSLVDQETYWVAKSVKENDIPFFAMRVVFDDMDTGLPPASCYDDYGEVRIPSFLSWLAKHPRTLLGTPSMFMNSVDARRKLADALESVIPALLR